MPYKVRVVGALTVLSAVLAWAAPASATFIVNPSCIGCSSVTQGGSITLGLDLTFTLDAPYNTFEPFGSITVVLDFGDGFSQTFVSGAQAFSVSQDHQYNTPGSYTLSWSATGFAFEAVTCCGGFILQNHGEPISYNTTQTLTVDALTAVPGPIAGAGLPGLIAACGGLVVLWRRQKIRMLSRLKRKPQLAAFFVAA
jgi:hypothetical protein